MIVFQRFTIKYLRPDYSRPASYPAEDPTRAGHVTLKASITIDPEASTQRSFATGDRSVCGQV